MAAIACRTDCDCMIDLWRSEASHRHKVAGKTAFSHNTYMLYLWNFGNALRFNAPTLYLALSLVRIFIVMFNCSMCQRGQHTMVKRLDRHAGRRKVGKFKPRILVAFSNSPVSKLISVSHRLRSVITMPL